MAFNAQAVRTAPSGHVWVAPVGTVEPDDITTPLNAAFGEFGYLTPDGVSITPSVETESINVWQSTVAVLTPITGVTFEVSFTIAELNAEGLAAFFNGSEWTNDGGVGRLDILSNPGSQERCLIVEWQDNREDNYRLVVPRAQMTNREALSLTRGDSTNQGITFAALDDDGVVAYLMTDNALLVPAS